MNPRMYVETIEIKESAGREKQESSSFPVWPLCVLSIVLGVGIAVETTLVILLGRAIVEMRELSVLLQYFR